MSEGVVIALIAVIIPLLTLLTTKVLIPATQSLYNLIKESGKAEEYKKVSTEAVQAKTKEVEELKMLMAQRSREVEECYETVRHLRTSGGGSRT